MSTTLKRMVMAVVACAFLSGCSCKEWGYCPHLFPNAERLTDNEAFHTHH